MCTNLHYANLLRLVVVPLDESQLVVRGSQYDDGYSQQYVGRRSDYFYPTDLRKETSRPGITL